MLMLVGFGAATACGSPLVIDSTAIATMAETILFFVLIICSPCLIFVLFVFEASLLEVPHKEQTEALWQTVPALRRFP